MSDKPHICVCICTYKRPLLLAKLLTGLTVQKTGGEFNYSVVIVDNDKLESARTTAESFARESGLQVTYAVEPEQNIASARNKAFANSQGDFIALIDDDEFPGETWLLNLFQVINQYQCAGVLAPVSPFFEQQPPAWVLKADYYDRPNHSTGHVLHWKNTRSGNGLIKRSILANQVTWFNPQFGSGGEDKDFFRRMIDQGHVFVWCNEAAVHEVVPPSRWDKVVLMKRALLRGKMALKSPDMNFVSVLKSAAAILAYTLCLPIFFLMGQHVLMKYLIKLCDHLGKVLAYCGIDVIKENYISG